MNVWVLAGVALVAFEAYALRNGKRTVTAATWSAFKRWPALAFLAGVLAAHFFLSQGGGDLALR